MADELRFVISMVNNCGILTTLSESYVDQWCLRLSKLVHISFERAEGIAYDKMMFYLKNLDKHSYRSKLYEDLIFKKPLEPIKDVKHAKRIINANKRHKFTNYDKNISDLHILERNGVLKMGTARNLARAGISKDDVMDVVKGNDQNFPADKKKYIANRLSEKN